MSSLSEEYFYGEPTYEITISIYGSGGAVVNIEAQGGYFHYLDLISEYWGLPNDEARQNAINLSIEEGTNQIKDAMRKETETPWI